MFLSVLPGNGDGDMEYSEQALLPLLTAYPKVRMEDCKKNCVNSLQLLQFFVVYFYDTLFLLLLVYKFKLF